MTAASAYPPGPDGSPAEGRVSEPSMEDILASIRRIIADDQQANGSRLGGRRGPSLGEAAAPAVVPPTPSAAAREEILDLARYVPGAPDAAADPAASGRADDSGDAPAALGHHAADASPEDERALDLHETEPRPHPAADLYATEDEDQAETGSRDVSLLAAPMSESVMSAFEALAATVVLENKPMLEAILRDLLRPMLKAWLDDNLPGLVERLVRIEIERVARGSRG